MESIFEKIPDLGDKIIKELDNQTLVKCKEVQRSWNKFINKEKILWFRMIQKYIGVKNEFSIAWRKVLTKVPADFVSQVAITTQQFHALWTIRAMQQMMMLQIPGASPIHVAASDGSVDLYKQIAAKLGDMNQTDIFGNFHPLFIAVLEGHYDVCKVT